MEQLWSHIYVCAKDQHFFLTQTREQLRIKPVNLLLGYLHQCKIDWTDASLWPEDYIEGQWKRVVPMSFLVASIGENLTGSYWVIDALCMGERLSRPAKSALHDQDQQTQATPALAGLMVMTCCVKEVQYLLGTLESVAGLLLRAEQNSMRGCILSASHE